MLFNGIDLEPYFRIKDIRGRGLIKRRINTFSVQGMDGEYVDSIEVPAKLLEVDIRIISKNLRKTVDELNAILATDGPVPIVFPDEPNMTYYGTVEDTQETGEKVHLGRHDTTIYIRRSDPNKYGLEIPKQFQSDIATIENKGTAEAKPIFELEVLQPVTFALIQNQLGEYMMIGQPVSAEDTIVEPTTHILTDTGDSMVGWTAGGNPPDGIAVGEARSIDGKLRAFDYGQGTGWHGPVIKKSLPQVLQDFNIQVHIEFNEAIADNTGRLQISLLDANNIMVGMLSFFDIYPQWFDKVGRAQLGENIIVSDRGKSWPNNFIGRLTLQRKGQEFIAKITQYENGVYKDTVEGKFTDFLNEHQTPIAQVQLHFGAFGTHTRPFMAVDKIQVLRLNDTTNKVPYIADVGDKITFDHVDENILLNGESIFGNGDTTIQKDFGAEFFKLKPDDNQLIVLPENTFNASVKFRERFK